jgi:hypothetical protein
MLTAKYEGKTARPGARHVAILHFIKELIDPNPPTFPVPLMQN